MSLDFDHWSLQVPSVLVDVHHFAERGRLVSHAVTGWEAALWGLLGSAVAEALNLAASMRPTGPRRRWRWPWGRTSDRPIVILAVALRLFVGCGFAAPLGSSGQLPTPFAAFLAGLAAPLLIARLFQTIPIAEEEYRDPVVPTVNANSARPAINSIEFQNGVSGNGSPSHTLDGEASDAAS